MRHLLSTLFPVFVRNKKRVTETYYTTRQHNKSVVQVFVRLSSGCRIPFSCEGVLPHQQVAVAMGGLGDTNSAPLIDARRNLVIRGLVSNYSGIND